MTSNEKPKLQATNLSVEDFLSSIEDDSKRHDAEYLNQLMSKISGKQPVMWGYGIIGFDQIHYKYESGREGDVGALGFSPRKADLTIYLLDGTAKYSELLSNLGPHKSSKVCLYVKRLDDIDLKVLEEVIKKSYDYVMIHGYNKL